MCLSFDTAPILLLLTLTHAPSLYHKANRVYVIIFHHISASVAEILQHPDQAPMKNFNLLFINQTNVSNKFLHRLL